MGERVSLFREPDAGNLPVRFDEREQETGPGQTGLRWRGESHVEYPPGDYSYCACSRLYSPLHSSCPGPRVLSEMAFYEKVIKVKADVAAILINCFPSA